MTVGSSFFCFTLLKFGLLCYLHTAGRCLRHIYIHYTAGHTATVKMPPESPRLIPLHCLLVPNHPKLPGENVEIHVIPELWHHHAHLSTIDSFWSFQIILEINCFPRIMEWRKKIRPENYIIPFLYNVYIY